MSLTQHAARIRRMCRRCGGPTGRAAVCAKCDPTKPTTEHTDKYPTPAEDTTTSTTNREDMNR